MPNGAVARSEVPPDHGLASLGLLMQLVGGVLAVLMAGLWLVSLIEAPGVTKLWLLLLLGLGAAGGAVQFGAGRAMSAGDRAALVRTRLYAILGWVQAALGVVFLASQTPSSIGHSLLFAGTLFGVWPTFLFVVTSLRPYRDLLERGLPAAPDRGAEGLAIYMSLFGTVGVLFALFLIQILAKGELLREWPGIVMLIATLLLLLRSVLHVAAGLKGVLRQDWPGFNEAAERYVLAGNIVAVLVGASQAIMLVAGTGGSLFGFVFIAMLVALLLVWPAVVRHVVESRPAPSIVAGEDGGPILAPDRGLTALGWLLLSMGVAGAAFALMGLLLGPGGASLLEGAFSERSGDERTGQLIALVVAGLEVFAGLSLVRMSPWRKPATLAYAGIGAVLSVINVVREFDDMRSIPLMGGPAGVMILPLIMAVVIPVGSGLLVLRGPGRAT